MSLKEEMWKYEQITGESAEHVPIIKLGAFLDGYEMAIKALEQQPCEDCISRKDVIILIDEATELHPYKVIGDSETYSNYNQGWEDACNWLYANVEGDNLKTVTSQPKVGKWIKTYEPNDAEPFILWECESCGLSERIKTHYCPNCGAKMEVDE